MLANWKTAAAIVLTAVASPLLVSLGVPVACQLVEPSTQPASQSLSTSPSALSENAGKRSFTLWDWLGLV